MFCVRKVTEDLYWVGGNDRRLALFENIIFCKKTYEKFVL